MGLFDFIKRRKKLEPKIYSLTQPGLDNLVAEVCSSLKMQFFLLEKVQRSIPPLLVKEGDGSPIIDRWLAGYLSGFYDAFGRLRGYEFELNALELIFSVFYCEDDAAVAIDEYHIARTSLEHDKEAAQLFGYDEFEKGMLAGGNNVFDWVNKRIQTPLGLYNRYA